MNRSMFDLISANPAKQLERVERLERLELLELHRVLRSAGGPVR
jgi:hypothetical protein